VPRLFNTEGIANVPRRPGPEFYRRPIFQSAYGSAFLSASAILMCAVDLVRFRGQLSILTILGFSLAFAWILKLWIEAIRSHKVLRDIYTNFASSVASLGSPLETALSASANATYSAVFGTSLLANIFMLLFTAAMRGRA
jgi:hypothetical protein